jgi:hypothetical protein
MSVVQDEPDSLVLEAAALIKEARRRQVRRRWAVAAVVVLVAAIVASVGATGWPARTGPKRVVPTSPEPGRGSPTGQFSASASSINFIGHWSVTSLTFPSSKEGFAFVTGASANGTSALLERTTNGGQTWLALREPPGPSDVAVNPSNLSFNSRSDGWWWGGSVLRRTSDSGANWQEVSTIGSVLSLATSGRRTWMVESVGFGPPSHCRSEVLLSSGDSALPVPVKNQPRLGTSCNWQLLPLSASTVYLSEAQDPVSQVAAPSYYWTTSDAGRSWVKRTTPCTSTRRWGSFYLTGIKQALWLLCPTGAFDTMPGLLPARSYVSFDSGNSWQFKWRGWFQVGQVVVTSKQQAWLWRDWNGALPGSVERTTDAGLKWSGVFPYWSKDSIQAPFFGHVDFVLPQSLVANGSWAALAVDTVRASAPDNLNHLIVGITDSSGKTWHWSYLRNLPLSKPSAEDRSVKK